MNKSQFDGILVFNVPILIKDSQDKEKKPETIFGFLFSTSEYGPKFEHNMELYASYLLAVEKLESEGGEIVNSSTWITGSGENLNVSDWNIRNRFYRELKDQLNYKLYEFDREIEYMENEIQRNCIMKQSLLDRYGVFFIEDLNIKNSN